MTENYKFISINQYKKDAKSLWGKEEEWEKVN